MYLSTRKNTGRPVFKKYRLTWWYKGRPVIVRVDPYFKAGPVYLAEILYGV